jgi:protein phosphatase
MRAEKLADTQEFVLPAGSGGIEPPQPFSSLMHVDFGARTHPGQVREQNEDHFLVARVGRSLETLDSNLSAGNLPARFEETGYLMIVADGIGGAAGGEVASEKAIHFAVSLLLSKGKWQMRVFPEEVPAVLKRAGADVRAIDQALVEYAEQDRHLTGMGTTMTGVYSVGRDLFLAHVGDSRAYLFRDGRLLQLTRDQTMAQALADAGVIPQEEVARHRLRHVLINALGGQGGQGAADVEHLDLADGDRLLLCSDGLTDMVPDAGIADVLRQTTSSVEACRILEEQALAAGGEDNVTVVLARYLFPSDGRPR